MINQIIINLARHRIFKAKDAQQQAKILLDNSSYNGSINRSYYAIFNAVRALLSFIKLDSKKHSGVISYFDRYFVKTGIMDKKFSHIVHSAFDIRQVCDYEDFAVITQEEAEMQFSNTDLLIKEIEHTFELIIQNKINIPIIDKA
jgi:uncharacterized protein (UPF0332 family)